MGFTPQQARLALASTDTGLDVQQALETLLSNGVGTEQEEETISDRPRRGLADFRDDVLAVKTVVPTAPNKAEKAYEAYQKATKEMMDKAFPNADPKKDRHIRP